MDEWLKMLQDGDGEDEEEDEEGEEDSEWEEEEEELGSASKVRGPSAFVSNVSYTQRQFMYLCRAHSKLQSDRIISMKISS